MRTINHLHVVYMFCLFCILPLTGVDAQGSISRSAMEELLDPEPVKQEVMVFQQPDGIFPELEEADAPYTVEYDFVNRGNKPISIYKVTVSCGCMIAEYDKKAVPAGGEGSIKISFNPKGYSGNIYRQAFVYTSLSEKLPTARLTLTGKVAPSKDPWRGYPYHLGALRARQKSVTFRMADRMGKIAEVIACGNSGDKTLSLSVKDLPPYLKFRTSRPVIAPGEEADLILIFDGTRLPAEIKSTISIPIVLEGLEDSADSSGQTITAIIQFDKSL